MNNLKKNVKIDIDNNHIIHIIEENPVLENLSKVKDIKLSLLEEDFFDKVNLIQWQDEEEKQLFIKEMLSLSPDEREEILEDIRRFQY